MEESQPQVSLAPTPTRINGRVFTGILVAAIAVGVYHAYTLRYVNDDAFISFRYARNFIEGLGLVYNAGERVEGYTNFLWTMLVSLGMKLGFDPVPWSFTLSISFFALTLALVGYGSWRFRVSTPGLVTVPLAALVLSVHHDMSVYATSGLETSMYTFLVTAGCGALLVRGSSQVRLLVAGGILTAAMLTRPDGVVVLAAAVLYVALSDKRSFTSVIVLCLPTALVFIPYWLWRWDYYGAFFPNTFYAKSIDLPYWSQGFVYAWSYISTYYVLALVPLCAGIIFWTWKGRVPAEGTAEQSWWQAFRSRVGEPFPLLLAALVAGVYTLFIIRIGGDFMFARFFIPITPVLIFALEYLIVRVTLRRDMIYTLAFIAVVATLFRNNLFTGGYLVDYIADEHQLYTMADLQYQRRKGEVLKKYFSGLPVTIAFFGSQARMVYYSEVPEAIEATTGLTDATVARQALAERGRPGHEKQALNDYIMRRGVHFIVGSFAPAVDVLKLDDLSLRILSYDNAIMDRLGGVPGAIFTKFPEYLDAYLEALSSFPPGQVERDYQLFTRYYFARNADPVHEQPIREFLAAHASPMAHGTDPRTR